MEKKNLIEILKKAVQAMEEYKKQPLEKTSGTRTYNESLEKQELDFVCGKLIKEAYMLGMSGNVCPTCNGTGKA
jgi:hypothetical protein